MNTTTIQLAGRDATLTFNRHARFRYGCQGGNLNALLTVPGQDYFQSVLLIWAGLDDATRASYPDPSLLVDYIAEDANEIFQPALEAVVAAGWLKLQDKDPG